MRAIHVLDYDVKLLLVAIDLASVAASLKWPNDEKEC